MAQRCGTDVMVRKIKQTDNAMGNAERMNWHCNSYGKSPHGFPAHCAGEQLGS